MKYWNSDSCLGRNAGYVFNAITLSGIFPIILTHQHNKLYVLIYPYTFSAYLLLNSLKFLYMVIVFEDFPRYIFSNRKCRLCLNLELFYCTKFLNTWGSYCKFEFETYIPKYLMYKAIIKYTWLRPFNHITGCCKRNI